MPDEANASYSDMWMCVWIEARNRIKSKFRNSLNGLKLSNIMLVPELSPYDSLKLLLSG